MLTLSRVNDTRGSAAEPSLFGTSMNQLLSIVSVEGKARKNSSFEWCLYFTNVHHSIYRTEFILSSSPQSSLVTSKAKVPSFIGANQDDHSMCSKDETAFASAQVASSARRNASGIASIRHCRQSEAQGLYCGLFRPMSSCRPQCINNDPREMVKTPV
jgi:hypothetical protein